jgi:hypothetical protein
MFSCMWKCVSTLHQKIKSCSLYPIPKIGCVIKRLNSIQLEIFVVPWRHLWPQPQMFIIFENPRICSEVGHCHICYIDASFRSNHSVI